MSGFIEMIKTKMENKGTSCRRRAEAQGSVGTHAGGKCFVEADVRGDVSRLWRVTGYEKQLLFVPTERRILFKRDDLQTKKYAGNDQKGIV